MTVDGSALGAANVLHFTAGQGVFDVTGGAGNDRLITGIGDDILSGGGGNDKIQMLNGGNTNGGADTVNGGDGNDVITADDGFGGFPAHGYTTADTIDGGAGHDTLVFNGDYSDGSIALGGNVTGIEVIRLSTEQIGVLTVTTDDAFLAAGQEMVIDARGLIALNSFDGLDFDGSAETDGHFSIFGARYNDHIEDGAGNDVIHTGGAFSNQGSDVIVSQGGHDAYTSQGKTVFDMGAELDSHDKLTGFDFNDKVVLDGDYSAGLHLGATTLVGVPEIDFSAGHSYKIVTDDATVNSFVPFTADGSALGAGDSLHFDGRAETDGQFLITGGAGNDALYGGAKADTIAGGDGGGTIYGGGDEDQLSGGAGADSYLYLGVRESTGLGFDTITGFDASMDSFNMPFRVNAVDPAIASGTLSLASFGSDLSHAVDAAHLGAHDAVLFTPDQGSLAGDTFLIVDSNGVAGFQTGLDYVIRLSDATNTDQLGTANFH